jgi:hypothetical protein
MRSSKQKGLSGTHFSVFWCDGSLHPRFFQPSEDRKEQNDAEFNMAIMKVDSINISLYSWGEEKTVLLFGLLY